MNHLFLCERREDLMTAKEVNCAPDWDVYEGYVIVADTADEALYHSSFRSIELGGTLEGKFKSIEMLLEAGLPVTEGEFKAWLEHDAEASAVQEMGRVVWSAKLIGIANMNQLKNKEIVITDFRNA